MLMDAMIIVVDFVIDLYFTIVSCHTVFAESICSF